MPAPNAGEEQAHFISRCIPIVIDDGTAQNPEQAAAVCYSIWRKHKGGKEAARDRKSVV